VDFPCAAAVVVEAFNFGFERRSVGLMAAQLPAQLSS
jgi:hypothetical protein